MLKRKFSEADLFLVIANLLPVYGVWFLNWKASDVFLVYCLETIIIGFFTLLKLGIVTAIRKSDWWENEGSRTMMHGSFFILFFFVHYGLFVGIQTTLFLNLIYDSQNIPNILQILLEPTKFIGKDAWLMLCVFVFGYGYENLTKFISNNEYRAHSFMRIMFEPYIRIFIQQFTVILGGLFLLLGAGQVFVFVFALIKIFFTVIIDYEKILNSTIEKAKLSGKQ